MKVSVLPILVIVIFIFCIGITRRAKLNQSINVAEGRSVYALLLALPLSQAAEAHRLISTNQVKGKVVLLP